MPRTTLPPPQSINFASSTGADRIDFSSIPGLPSGDVDFTIEIWTLYESLPADTVPYESMLGVADGMLISTDSASGVNELSLYINNTAGLQPGLAMVINRWEYRAWNSNAAANNYDSFFGFAGGPLRVGASAPLVNMGATAGPKIGGGTTQAFGGAGSRIGLLRIWNRRLVISELLKIWNRRFPRNYRLPGLVFCWDPGLDMYRNQISGEFGTHVGILTRDSRGPDLDIHTLHNYWWLAAGQTIVPSAIASGEVIGILTLLGGGVIKAIEYVSDNTVEQASPRVAKYSTIKSFSDPKLTSSTGPYGSSTDWNT